MKQLFFTLLMLVPMTLWAQDNTWERPEVDEQAEAAKAKENVNAKYLRGAVPEVDGKVVFTRQVGQPDLRHPAPVSAEDDEREEPVGKQ